MNKISRNKLSQAGKTDILKLQNSTEKIKDDLNTWRDISMLMR